MALTLHPSIELIYFYFYVIDPAGGSSVNWSYGVGIVKLAYTLEMRDNGKMI